MSRFRTGSRGQSIAIIGLGGTGSYVLDLVAKTPVREIHILDDDYMDWHNFMRAPGAPTDEEIELRHQGCLRKTDYYHPKYESLREGIHTYAIRVDSKSTLGKFLSAHPIDFAFVCIDQLTEGDSPRQDAVYCALSDSNVPFIDSGVSISVEGSAVSGSVTTSFYDSSLHGVEGCHTECEGRGRCTGLSQRPAAGSERIGGIACRDGVAAPHGAVCLGVRFVSS